MENIQINKTKTINNYDNINCHNYFEKWAFSMSKGVNVRGCILFLVCLKVIKWAFQMRKGVI